MAGLWQSFQSDERLPRYYLVTSCMTDGMISYLHHILRLALHNWRYFVIYGGCVISVCKTIRNLLTQQNSHFS